MLANAQWTKAASTAQWLNRPGIPRHTFSALFGVIIAPVPRLRRPILRRGRTATAAGPAHSSGHAGHGPGAELRRVLAATYHQVWWPDTSAVRFEDGGLPVWDEAAVTYLDPATGEVLPAGDQALDAIDDQDDPLHVARFGERFDAQGVLAGSKDAARCIGYLTKYLTKQVADCHQAASDAQRTHVERLADALRYEPCSPRCANWLRYGIQPKNARPGLTAGA